MTVTQVGAMQEQGNVVQVYIAFVGDEAAADAALGASVITLYDTSDFSELGGQVQIGSTVYDYLTINDDLRTITLSSTLVAGVTTDDRVYLYPLAEEKWAMVQLPDENDVVLARIPHQLQDRFSDGVREDNAQESVIITLESGVWTVLDIVAKIPEIDEAYIGSDGISPVDPPVIQAIGGIGAIHIRVTTPVINSTAITYKYYMGTSPGFTADATTLLAEDPSPAYTVRREIDGDPLAYDTSYYFKARAVDVDGEGPLSTEVSAQLMQINTPDIATSYIYAGNIVVDQLLGGTLSADVLLSATITTRAGGSGAGLDLNQELTRYDSSGVPTAILGDTNSFKGTVESDGLTVTGTAAFRSTTEISKDGMLVLQAATTAPAAKPSAVVGWAGTFTEPLFTWNYGLHWTGSDFATVGDSAPPLIQRSVGADVVLPFGDPRPAGGVVQVGTDWITLGIIGDIWYLTRYNSSGVKQVQTTYTPLAGTWGSGGNLANFLAPASIGPDYTAPTTSFIIAEHNDSNDTFRIQKRTASTLAVSATVNTSANAGFQGPVVGVALGNFDYGSARYVILSRSGNHFWVFSSAGVYDFNDAFAAPSPGSMSGFTWDGTRFWSTNARAAAFNSAQVYKHSTENWYGLDPKTHYATTTWRDTDATGGTHETDMGQVGSFPLKKRATVTLTSPTIPDSGGTDDPNAVSFYVGNINTLRTNLFLQTLPATGVNTITLGDDLNPNAGTNPPLTNNFPGATPARMKTAAVDGSGNPHFQVEGDGDITRGPHTAGLLTQVLTAVCTTLLDLTTTETDIPGATVTFTTLRPNARFLCMGSFYFSAINTSGSVGTGRLSVDGVTQPRYANFTGTSTTPDRNNSSQMWEGILAAAGSHTLKLRGHSGTAAVHRVNTDHTTITVFVFE